MARRDDVSGDGPRNPRHPRFRLLILAVAWICGFAVSSATTFATSVEPLNLLQVTERANKIVVADVTRVTYGADTDDIPCSWIELAVVSGIANADAGDVLVIKIYGAPVAVRDAAGRLRRATVAGMPRFAVSERVLLFLTPASTKGFCSPVGLAQGCFRVRTDPRTRVVVAVNDAGNRTVAYGLSASDLTPLRLTPAESAVITSPGRAAPLGDLLDCVGKIRARGR